MKQYRLRAEAVSGRKEYTGNWFNENCKPTLDRLAKEANDDNPGRRHWVDEKEESDAQNKELIHKNPHWRLLLRRERLLRFHKKSININAPDGGVGPANRGRGVKK
jgi:hypothetical protein